MNNDINKQFVEFICTWCQLSLNPGINKLNYQWLKQRMDIIREDLIKAVFHPKRLEYYLEHYNYNIFD